MAEAMRVDPEYGPVMAVLTPQANTCVEPEMQRLLSGTMLTARCTSASSDSRQRLLDYAAHLPITIAQFDIAPVRVYGFACTGSSYLIGLEEESSWHAGIQAQLRAPLITATQAIRRALQSLSIHRVAMFAPYPDWLLEAGCAYWRDAGFDLVAVKSLTQSMTDTRGIYDLHSAELHPLLSSWETSNAQAVLLSGTGMPSLSLMAKPSLVLPHLSSNLCLAWAMQCAAQSLDAQGKRDALLHMISPQAAWRKEWP